MINAAPITAAGIVARLRTVDGDGSGIEADLVMVRRPSRGMGTSPNSPNHSTLHAGLANPGPLSPTTIANRAVLGL